MAPTRRPSLWFASLALGTGVARATPCGAPAATSPEEWVQRGVMLQAAGALQAARACFADAHTADPRSAQAAYFLGEALASGGVGIGDEHLREAEAALEYALELEPSLAAAHAALARLTPHADAAAARWRRALAVAGRGGAEADAAREGLVSALTEIARNRADASDWSAAAELLDEAANLAPDRCELHIARADALAYAGETRASAKALRRALAEDHFCVDVHPRLARLALELGELDAALAHARAAVELRPAHPPSLSALAAAEAAAAKAAPAAQSGVAAVVDEWAGTDGRAEEPSARAPREPSAPLTQPLAPHPPELALPAPVLLHGARAEGGADEARAWSCPAKRSLRPLLFVSPFEEGCYHDPQPDPRLPPSEQRADVARRRQLFASCGQFHNVQASLAHALALSRLLCRTLVLPGVYVRSGVRMTRISGFAEAWQPTSHALNVSVLSAAFDVVEMADWRAHPSVEGTADAGAASPRLLCRCEGGRPAQVRFLGSAMALGPAHADAARAEWAPFPHFVQQQTSVRRVRSRGARATQEPNADEGAAVREWWRAWLGSQTAAQAAAPLAFDAPPHAGLSMDRFNFDSALRFVRAHMQPPRWAQREATAWAAGALRDARAERYVCAHIRRGVDRLHDHCLTEEGQRAYGWDVPRSVCYPPLRAVVSELQRALAAARTHVVVLATDSPRPELFEELLAEALLQLHDAGAPANGSAAAVLLRYGRDGARARVPREDWLHVDTELCARAHTFVGNVPSTVTASIVHRRDARGSPRSTMRIFGFDDEQLAEVQQAIPRDLGGGGAVVN